MGGSSLCQLVRSELCNYNVNMASSTHDTKHKWTSWRKANFDFFKKRLDSLDNRLTFLDIGSGSEQFREVTWRFKEVISVDFKQYGTTKIVADITKGIPLEDKTVDIVFLSNTLEHLPDGQFILHECFRVLRERTGGGGTYYRNRAFHSAGTSRSV